MVVFLLIFYDNFEKETILSIENYGFWEIQLSSSAFSEGLPAQLSSAQQIFFPAQLAELSKKYSTAQLSSAQLFFSKFPTLLFLSLSALLELLFCPKQPVRNKNIKIIINYRDVRAVFLTSELVTSRIQVSRRRNHEHVTRLVCDVNMFS